MSKQKTTAEEMWLADARDGSDEAFARLVEQYRPMLRGLAVRLQTADVAADDLEQEGLLGLLGAVRGYDAQAGAAFSTYAYVCAYRRMLTALQKSGNAPADCRLDGSEDDSFADEELDPEQMVLARDDEAELDKRLRRLLTPTEYDVLRLHMAGYTYKEIAEKLHAGCKTVDNALQRIRRKLK